MVSDLALEVVALVTRDPNTVEVSYDVSNINWTSNLPTRNGDDEGYADYLARLTDDELIRYHTHGLSDETYNLIRSLNFDFFVDNDCTGYENEHMISIDAASND